MRKNKCVIRFLAAFLFFPCLFWFTACSKKESLPTPKPAETTKILFNLSERPGLLKLKRAVLKLEDEEKRYSFTMTPAYKEAFDGISFPFPFSVTQVYMEKGATVTKGESIILLESTAMRNAMARYQRGVDLTLEKTFASLGINPIETEPFSLLTIVLPSGGFLAEIYVSAGKQYNAGHPIAAIQKTRDLSFNGSIPNEQIEANTSFVAKINGDMVSLSIASAVKGESQTELTLKAFVSGVPSSFTQKMSVDAVTKIQNIIKLDKKAVFVRNNVFYCFVEPEAGLVEKRAVDGYFEGEVFIVKSGLRETETVINDNVTPIFQAFKI